jgi:hypothetical protein
MAIKDYKVMLSDGQALTAVGNTITEDVLDLGAVKDAFGATDYGNLGGLLWLNVICTTAFTMTTSTGTVTAKIYCGAADPPTDLILTGPIVTKPTAGQTLLKVPLPTDVDARYLALNYTLSTAATLGKVDAWLGLDAEINVP